MPLVPVAACKEIAKNQFLLNLEVKWLKNADPGQFVHLKLPGILSDPLLRRPFSIHHFEPISQKLDILFQVVGKTTDMMSKLRYGDMVDILAPLGRGFTLPSAGTVLLVGGGIGLAPLYFLACRLLKLGISFEFLIGGVTAVSLPPKSYFAQKGIEVLPATEDGTAGFKGLVTELLEKKLKHENDDGQASYNKNNQYKMIYACGPHPMLKVVAAQAKEAKIISQLSLESLMACGVGACLGCVCPVKPKNYTRLPVTETPTERKDLCSDLNKDQIGYARICKEGPVFEGDEVIFHEQ